MNQTIKIKKFPKLLSQRIGKRYYKILETSVINSPLLLYIIESLRLFNFTFLQLYTYLPRLKVLFW